MSGDRPLPVRDSASNNLDADTADETGPFLSNGWWGADWPAVLRLRFDRATTGNSEQSAVTSPEIPTLYAWAGGLPALERLTQVFYGKVRQDPLLQPVFAHMDDHHPQFVAWFLAEVFGGPPMYSRERGGHAHMIQQHLARHLTDAQRRRWVDVLLDSADEAGLPTDPEFRSAFVAYLEWGTRLAVINSQPGAAVVADAPMPQWGWGVPGGPYQPES